MIFVSTLLPVPGFQEIYPDNTDTSSINRQNKVLFTESRKNPDLVIGLAHQTLKESREINYLKGEADASLALGSAWFARYYNKYDSALYYDMQAYNIYSELGDIHGKARASYFMAYVFSLKGNLQESERYASLSLKFFKETSDSKGVINTYHVLSYLAKQQQDLNKSRSLIENAIETARSVKDTLSLADVLNTLGNIYKDMALFGQAIDTYFEALNLWELKGDSSGMAIAYGSIGLMYLYQKEWDKALEFNFRKVPLSFAEGNLWEVSKTYNTIAQIFNSTSRSDSALVYLSKSLKLNEQMNFTSGIADAYYDIASTFLLTQSIDSAYYYINKALALAKEIDAPALTNYLIILGKVNISRGEYSLALSNVRKAYNMAKEHQLPMVILESSALLSDVYRRINRKDLAYDYLSEYRKLNDSINNDEFLKKVTRLEIQYNFDKKEKEAEYARMEERILHDNKMRQQKLYVKGLLILVTLLVIISLLYIRHNRLRAKYSRIDLEQRLLRAQMNPHFIFNSLCAVQDFILAGKPQKANTFLTKIARLMRNILDNSRDEFISLEKEIETVRLYLDLQQLRFKTGFEYKITLDEMIDPENYSIPPMLTQPCVENSIEHGLLPLKEKGSLEIIYRLSNGLIRLEVTDNGIGRKEAAARTEEHKNKKSVSTMMTTERLKNFRKTLRQKCINYEITDLYENGRAAGTKVVMMLPFRTIYA